MQDVPEQQIPSAASPGRRRLDPPRPDIVVRRPALQLDPKRSKLWLGGGTPTLLLHALSPTFPGGEFFFIKSVMAFKDQIADPRLREEMHRFAAQEAVHTREHLAYDESVQGHYDLKLIEEICKRDLARTYGFLRRTKKRWFNGPRIALAVTVALEHVTATLGHQVLSDDRVLADAEPEFARLWRWHAAEEIEHKAVAFDVFEAVGGTWLERTAAFTIMTNLLLFDTLRLVGHFLAVDGRRFDRKAWGEIGRFLFVSPGVVRRSLPQLADFYRPGFHPWDHDDRALLEGWQARNPSLA